MQIHIRKATAEDSKQLLILNEEFNGMGVTTEVLIVDSLINNKTEIVFIATINEHAVGFICGQICRSICHRTLHGEIGELFVSEEYRKNGIGRKLMSAMEQEFKENNALVVTLQTSVQNKVAQLFYERCGYIGKQKLIYRKNIN